MTESNAIPKHVFVTGAGSGIGRATALRILRQGSACCALDNNAGALASLANEAPGALLLTHACDVTDQAGLDAALGRATGTFGPVGGMVHAAGILLQGSLHDSALSPSRFREVLRVNVEGTWMVGRTIARHMIVHGGGSLVFVSSNAGTTPRIDMGAYCCSKAGATMLARCFALELGAHNVRCNVVSPGSTDTPMLHSMLGESDFSKVVEGDSSVFRTGIPLGRIGEPEDVAQAAMFLLSNAAKHITGHDLRVDGGATWS